MPSLIKNKKIEIHVDQPKVEPKPFIAAEFNHLLFYFVIETNRLLFSQCLTLQLKQEETIQQVKDSTTCLLDSQKVKHKAIIDSQKFHIEELTTKIGKQSCQLAFLEQEERTRKEAAKQLLMRRDRLKKQKKKAVRDAATYPEFVEGIKIINSKHYRCEFVRNREKVALLLLFLTGIRVANLCEITASNLQCLLTEETSVYFQVNLIKSKKHLVYRTLLTKVSLSIALEYKSSILTILNNKNPSDYVFTSKKNGTPLERAAFTKSLNKILKQAGKVFGKNISSHSFRIGHVTALIDEFGLLHAQKLIGHQNAETTLRYARNKLGTAELSTKMKKVEKQKLYKFKRHKSANTIINGINDNNN